MKRILRLSFKLCVEVAVTTAAAVFIIGVAFAAERAIVELGRFFDVRSTEAAFVFKYGLFLFDIFLFWNMMWEIWKRRKDEE